MDELLLHDILRTSARRVPHRVAISYRGELLTYEELLAAVEHLAAVLSGRGIRHGDRVGWWANVHLPVSAPGRLRGR
jgi:acyl-CoA synthetase (AMP-forming)/AMP-acid ligase II